MKGGMYVPKRWAKEEKLRSVTDFLSVLLLYIPISKETNKQTLIPHRTVVIQGQNPCFWYLVTKSCLVQFLWNPTDCHPPGSSVLGISQVRILECAPFPSLGDLPDPGVKSVSLALAGRFFITEPPGKPQSPPPPTWGHLAMSEEVFDCHNWGRNIIPICRQRSGVVLNILQRTSESPQQRIFWSRISIVLRSKNPHTE